MIRPLTCICLLLAGGSGLYLYQSKHQAQMLDREIERTMRATDVARDRIGVLRGEWALLNEPERLAALSQSHLGLKSLSPSQYVTAVELGVRLPPPGPADAPGEEEAADALPLPPTLVAEPMSAHSALAKPQPVIKPRTPIQAVSVQPPQPPVALRPVLAPVMSVSASTVVAATTPRPVPARPAPPAAASAASAVAPQRANASPPAGMSIGESVARTARLQGVSVAAPIPQPAYNPPAGAPLASAQPVQSALGGVRPLLPPPVPFGSAASIASAR